MKLLKKKKFIKLRPTSSVKIEFSDQAFHDNLRLLQVMIDRIVVQDRQKNLGCRLLRMENVMNALRNDVTNEKKSTTEIVDTETIDDFKPINNPHPE